MGEALLLLLLEMVSFYSSRGTGTQEVVQVGFEIMSSPWSNVPGPVFFTLRFQM